MGIPVNHADVETVYLKIYRGFMEALDAIDNGEAHVSVLSASSGLQEGSLTAKHEQQAYVNTVLGSLAA